MGFTSRTRLHGLLQQRPDGHGAEWSGVGRCGAVSTRRNQGQAQTMAPRRGVARRHRPQRAGSLRALADREGIGGAPQLHAGADGASMSEMVRTGSCNRPAVARQLDSGGVGCHCGDQHFIIHTTHTHDAEAMAAFRSRVPVSRSRPPPCADGTSERAPPER